MLAMTGTAWSETYTYADGGKYVGEAKDGLRHGQGTYTFADGAKYVGEWKDGNFHGQGTYTFADGGKYVGEYKDDLRHGQGTYTYPNGGKYVGEWKDGNFHGQGTYTFVDGEKYVGEWKDGKKISNKQILKEQYESYFVVRKCHDMSPLLISYQKLKEAKQYIRAIDDFYKSKGVDTDMVYKSAEENPSKNVKSIMGSMDFIILAGGSYSQEMKMACNIYFKLINKPEKPKGKKDF